MASGDLRNQGTAVILPRAGWESKAQTQCRAALKWVFLNLWAGQAVGRNKAFYGPLF
jgi:hypothetical protein